MVTHYTDRFHEHKYLSVRWQIWSDGHIWSGDHTIRHSKMSPYTSHRPPVRVESTLANALKKSVTLARYPASSSARSRRSASSGDTGGYYTASDGVVHHRGCVKSSRGQRPDYRRRRLTAAASKVSRRTTTFVLALTLRSFKPFRFCPISL